MVEAQARIIITPGVLGGPGVGGCSPKGRLRGGLRGSFRGSFRSGCSELAEGCREAVPGFSDAGRREGLQRGQTLQSKTPLI